LIAQELNYAHINLQKVRDTQEETNSTTNHTSINFGHQKPDKITYTKHEV